MHIWRGRAKIARVSGNWRLQKRNFVGEEIQVAPPELRGYHVGGFIHIELERARIARVSRHLSLQKKVAYTCTKEREIMIILTNK